MSQKQSNAASEASLMDAASCIWALASRPEHWAIM